MAVLKCKMCGGSLGTAGNANVCRCEYCGTEQTLPRAKDEITADLFNRANDLRTGCEFDKAQEVYEKIVQTSPDEPEAYWGMVLCKYGIEYVDDTRTNRKIPTCHRTMYESVLRDVDYRSAISFSDDAGRAVYEREAEEIEKLQRDILNIVRSEKPFDVFICYKEKDESGVRTKDSSIANDIYYQLTQEGFKVFYSAITLEDKIGQEYEPYIFAALQSAKVMLVVGTKQEYFNAPWVRNEWSRYLKFMKDDRRKMLIPCYKDMDPYDLPEEFARLQAQDMGKIGFINDVIRGIKKVLASGEEQHTAPAASVAASDALGSNLDKRLQRAAIFLSDADYANAAEFCERILNADPECARAYYFKFLAEHGCRNNDDAYSQPRVDFLADYYIKGYGYDVSDEDTYRSRVQYVLGNSLKNAVNFSRGAEHEEYLHLYEGMISLIRAAVSRKEQLKIDEEKRMACEVQRQQEAEESQRKMQKSKTKRKSMFQSLAILSLLISIISVTVTTSSEQGSGMVPGFFFIAFVALLVLSAV